MRVLSLAIALTIAPPAQTRPTLVALTHATVVDVRTGRLAPDTTVLIAGTRIQRVVPTAKTKPPANASVVDVSGAYVIPGLWDMHAHALPYPTRPHALDIFFPLFVANGITGIREMGALPESLSTARARAASEVERWPRLVAAGPVVDGPHPMLSPPFSIAVATPDEGRKAVATLAAAGSDFVKVVNLIPRDAYFALAAAAQDRRLPFVGHVPFQVSASEASDAGQRSLEHMVDIGIECSADEAAIRRDLVAAATAPNATASQVARARSAAAERAAEHVDARKCARLFDRLARNRTHVVPTFIIGDNASHLARAAADPRLRYMEAATIAAWRERPVTGSEDQSVRQRRGEYNQWLIREMSRAGVTVLAGTDSPGFFTLPGFSLHQELVLLVEAGLTPLQALQAATLNAAAFLEPSADAGAVERGKIADLVLVDANPLADIHNAGKIRGVVVNGRYLDRHALDELLAGVERAASRFSAP